MGFLIAPVLLGLCVLLALAPPRRGGPPGFFIFIYSFLASQVPFFALYYIVGSTVRSAIQDNLNNPAGWTAVALALATALGIALIVRREFRAGPVLDRALADGLGADGLGADGLGDAMVRRSKRALPYARILIWPFLMRRADVERVANIRYGEGGRYHRLDVYRHRSHPAGAPVFVHLHGGGMVMGRKNQESLPLLYHLASQGWVCVSANYSLRSAARFPGPLIDVKRIIAWVREHGDTYGADPRTLLVAGTSAGGQLAALAGLTAGDLRYQPGFEQTDTSVTAVVYLSGFYGLPQGAWSPMTADMTAAPPFLVIHGANDSVVPVENARLFVDRLRRESPSPVVYAELPGAQHAFDRFHSIRFDTIATAVESFATWARCRRGAHGCGNQPPMTGWLSQPCGDGISDRE